VPEVTSLNLLSYFIVIAIAFDLLIRWISFSRVESVAIDTAVFSMVYSLINLLTEIFSKGNRTLEWGLKTIFGFLIALGLASLHRYLLKRLEDKIFLEMRKLQHALPNGGKKDQMLDLAPVIQYATDLALVAWKKGKKDRREIINLAIKGLGLDPNNIIDKKTLLLNKDLRVFMLIIFFFGGFISILIALWKYYI